MDVTSLTPRSAPFLVVGDTAHHLMSNVPTSGYDAYLKSRKGYGFNTVNMWGTCAHGLNSTGAAADGTLPFTVGICASSYDLSTPNDAYWSKVDAFLNQAAAAGFTVMFLPLSVADYMITFRSNGAAKVFDFGVYIGNRYKGFPNIVYQDGNDFQTWRTASDMALVKQFIDGIESVDTAHVHGIQLDYLRSYSNQAASVLGAENKSDFVYTYYEVYDYMLKAYNSTPALPTYLGEANYEGANNTHGLSKAANQFIVRQESWYAMTAGGAGFVWGNMSVNHFDSNYPGSLDTTATAEVVHLPNLFKQYSWWNLVPDQTHAVVTAGYGTPAPNNLNMYDATYATTTWLANGTLAITYTPVAHSLTAAMTKFVGPVRALVRPFQRGLHEHRGQPVRQQRDSGVHDAGRES